jgi:hypothetical protein
MPAVWDNDIDFIRALDRTFGIDSKFADKNPAIMVHYSEQMMIAVLLPYTSYRSGLQDAIRKREPIDSVTPREAVSVAVSPSRITAPDIEKIIVERLGREIPPIGNTLQPAPLRTPNGAEVVLHVGSVLFPCSAFMPGSAVRVTAVPRVGSNIEKMISSSDLAKFWPHKQ